MRFGAFVAAGALAWALAGARLDAAQDREAEESAGASPALSWYVLPAAGGAASASDQDKSRPAPVVEPGVLSWFLVPSTSEAASVNRPALASLNAPPAQSHPSASAASTAMAPQPAIEADLTTAAVGNGDLAIGNGAVGKPAAEPPVPPASEPAPRQSPPSTATVAAPPAAGEAGLPFAMKPGRLSDNMSRLATDQGWTLVRWDAPDFRIHAEYQLWAKDFDSLLATMLKPYPVKAELVVRDRNVFVSRRERRRVRVPLAERAADRLEQRSG